MGVERAARGDHLPLGVALPSVLRPPVLRGATPCGPQLCGSPGRARGSPLAMRGACAHRAKGMRNSVGEKATALAKAMMIIDILRRRSMRSAGVANLT